MQLVYHKIIFFDFYDTKDKMWSGKIQKLINSMRNVILFISDNIIICWHMFPPKKIDQFCLSTRVSDS